MAEQKIELRKVRDFGEVINDTFVFLRQNLKPLMASFFAIAGLFLLAQAVFSGLYQAHLIGKMAQIKQASQGMDSWSRLSSMYGNIFTAEYFFVMLFALLSLVSVKVVLGAYFKYYLENDGRQPGIDETWHIFKRYFLKVLIYNIPAYLVLIAGFIFCIFPGFYFLVVLAPFNMIIMIEDKDFGTSFSRCFEIIKDNFWNSFGVYIIAGIIYIMSSWIINSLINIVFSFASNLTLGDYSEAISIIKSFFAIFSYTFYTIYFVAAALQYFSLTEQKDGTGILNRIDSIGSGKDNFDHIEEQY